MCLTQLQVPKTIFRLCSIIRVLKGHRMGKPVTLIKLRRFVACTSTITYICAKYLCDLKRLVLNFHHLKRAPFECKKNEYTYNENLKGHLWK